MTAPDPRVGEIEARLAAATPGPWEVRTDDLTDDVDVVHDQEHVSFVASCGHKAQPGIYADAEFIANAPADVAYLLAELRKAHEALGRVEGVATDLATRGTAIEAKGYNGSINSNINEGRSIGYLEGARLIRAAVAAANGDPS